MHTLNIYTLNKLLEKIKLWRLLQSILKDNEGEIWILVGYFNSPIFYDKKFGSHIDGPQLVGMNDLKQCLLNIGLVDLRVHGTKYNCLNRKIMGKLIMRKLDRIMISKEWIHDFT